jgi:hypothetical protein
MAVSQWAGDGEVDQTGVSFNGSNPSIVGNKIQGMQFAEGKEVEQTGITKANVK